MSSGVLIGLTLVFMAVILGAFYVARERLKQDPVQAAALEYRRSVSGPLGLLPPRREPFGLALTTLTLASFIAAVVLLFANSNSLVLACGVMILSNMFAVRRDKAWLTNNAEYQAILAGGGD